MEARAFGVFYNNDSSAVLSHVSDMASEATCAQFCLDMPDVNSWMFSTNGSLASNECKCSQIPSPFCKDDLGPKLQLVLDASVNVTAYIIGAKVSLVDFCEGKGR